MKLDEDLRSIQQARELVLRARGAWERYAHFTQEQVDAIVSAAARAASEASYDLARLAVEETGFGVVEHKFIKNKFAAEDVYRFIRDMKTVGIIRELPDVKVVEIAEPVGVIAAVVPSTNPTSTAIYKVLIALKSRNTIVLSPHPAARRCIRETSEIMKRAVVSAGAPDGVVDCMTEVSLEGTRELMSHRRTSVVLATGGMGLVRAAYSSGKPAFGVGPGNVPAYIESTADVARAVRDVLTGKSYDNGTLCCSEQALICDRAIESTVRQAVVDEGGFFLDSNQIDLVSKIAVLPSRLANPEIVGKSAVFIARKAGFDVPETTRVLVAELVGVGRDYPLSIEKLAPILAFYVVGDWKEGCERAKEILRYGGMGHTLAIHSTDDKVIRQFALEKPAFRIVANSTATHGAVGFSTGLSPAMTLGCGAHGGNITSDNITPMHLINVKRLAYGIRPVDIGMALEAYGYPGERTVPEPVRREADPPRNLEQRISRFLEVRGLPVRARGESPASREVASLEGTVAAPTPPPVAALEFVSEEDVRSALSEGRKLPVGAGTVITPSARDLGNENNVFLRV
ncbi:MAG TPA: aldehyde dehydrogenase family protein [Vicinamibacteria bacterium]|nr:aldehyde dehydrogenase family protein [Vicinamibacteria bacterium]